MPAPMICITECLRDAYHISRSVNARIQDKQGKGQRNMNRKTTLLSLILLVFFVFKGMALSDGNLASAKKCIDVGEYKKAIGLLKKVTKKEPSNIEAWTLLGNSYLRLTKYKYAHKAYEQVIRNDHENEEALLGLGVTWSSLRKHSNAIEVFKKIIEINPKNAKAHFELGVSYDRTARLSDAFEQYEILKILDKDLADKLYHIILGN